MLKDAEQSNKSFLAVGIPAPSKKLTIRKTPTVMLNVLGCKQSTIALPTS
jgi:hypothetical protein